VRTSLLRGVMVVCALAVPALALAQGSPPFVSGAVYLYLSPATTHLDAQAITAPMQGATGKSTYENDAWYLGAAAYAHFPHRLGVDAAILGGTSKTIDPQVANGYTGMNPLTHERVLLWDASATYTLCAGRRCGIVDLMVGMLTLRADPGPLTVPTNPAVGNFTPFVIDNPATRYSGLAIGLKGYYPLRPNIGIDYKVQYLPSYSVNGHYAEAGDNTLSPKDVIRYRFGVNYYLNRRGGLTVGYQGIRLNAEMAQGASVGEKAIVTNHGFYFGGSVNY